MATQEDIVLAVLGLVASALYFFVAGVQSKREVSTEGQGALRGFIIWWGGLAVLGVATAFVTLAGSVEQWGLNGVRAYFYTLFGVILSACGGLVYYLAYLYTGKKNTRIAAGVYYALMFVFLIWLIEAHSPHIDVIHEGQPDAGEQGFHLHEQPSALASATLSLGLVAPLLLSAIAYAMLFFRTTDITARYRIGMVSSGFVLWFLYSTVGTIARLLTGSQQSFTDQVMGQLLGVLAATLTLLAYEPPRWIRQRLHLRTLRQGGEGVGMEPPRLMPI